MQDLIHSHRFSTSPDKSQSGRKRVLQYLFRLEAVNMYLKR